MCKIFDTIQTNFDWKGLKVKQTKNTVICDNKQQENEKQNP